LIKQTVETSQEQLAHPSGDPALVDASTERPVTRSQPRTVVPPAWPWLVQDGASIGVVQVIAIAWSAAIVGGA
jgi:hypothetical protein